VQLCVIARAPRSRGNHRLGFLRRPEGRGRFEHLGREIDLEMKGAKWIWDLSTKGVECGSGHVPNVDSHISI
jgi:hypothetical protein